MKKANPPRHQLLATRHRAVGAFLLLTSYFLLSTPSFASIEPVALKKTTTEVEAQSRAQSGAQSNAILHALANEPLSANALVSLLGLKSKTGAFKRSVNELIDAHLIEYTIPDKPKSRLQKYRLTETGRKRKSEG